MKQYFNPEAVLTTLERLMSALPLTLIIAAVSLAAGMLLAAPIASARMKRHSLQSWLAAFFVSFIRGTPALVQLFLIFFGLPEFLKIFGLNITGWDKRVFAAITFTLFSSAFLSEVYRSAYLAVDQGQMEAALSIGMTKFQALMRILFPQALIIALPNIGNQAIGMVKETSLMFTIGIADLMGIANRIVSDSYGLINMEAFIAVGLIYCVLCVIIGQALKLLEVTVGKWCGVRIEKPNDRRGKFASLTGFRRGADGL